MASVEINWPAPPKEWEKEFPSTRAPSQEIHVWAIPLAAADDSMREKRNILASSELERADRFRFLRDRERFITAHAALRVILGDLLRVRAAGLEFSCGPRGKPALSGAFAGRLHFNLSHSDDLALLAINQAGPVGVDVEKIRAISEMAALADRYFSVQERAALADAPERFKPELFFKIWTRKESLLKATGEGLAASLDQVNVVAATEIPNEFGGWRLFDLAPASGFTAALATRSADFQLHCWRWTGKNY